MYRFVLRNLYKNTLVILRFHLTGWRAVVACLRAPVGRVSKIGDPGRISVRKQDRKQDPTQRTKNGEGSQCDLSIKTAVGCKSCPIYCSTIYSRSVALAFTISSSILGKRSWSENEKSREISGSLDFRMPISPYSCLLKRETTRDLWELIVLFMQNVIFDPK